MTFHRYSEEILKEYLGTVAYVDDLIFLKREETKAVGLKIESPRVMAAKKDEEPPLPKQVTEGKDTDNKSETPIKQLEPNINPAAFTNAFLEKGIHCSLFEVENDEDSLDNLKKALKKSDVVILDWQMHHDDGRKARELLLSVIKSSQQPELRLFIIFTDDPGYITLLPTTILPKLKEEGIIKDIPDNVECVFNFGHSKIVVLEKKNGKKSETAVSDNELPDRIIKEFAQITSGLVSNTVLKAVSVIRDNTNKLLAVFHKELDPAFLTHRSLLANEADSIPEDAEELLRDTIMDSIHSLVSNAHISKNCSIEQIQKWLTSNGEFKKEEVTIQNRKYKFNTEARLKLVDKGVSEAEVEVCKANNVNGEISKAEKKTLKSNPLEYFTPKTFIRENLNEEFAILTHQIINFQGDDFVPSLSFGSVVKNNNKYYLCIQPPCDTVRIPKNERKAFIFIELELNNSNNQMTRILAREKNHCIKLRPNLKSYEIKVFKFQETKNGQVTAEKNIFKSSTYRMKFEWICDIKKDHTQRIVNEYASVISRVGLNESEWLRIN